MLSALRTWLRQLFCRHARGRLVAIEWDGESVFECERCGSHVRKPLK